MKKLYFLNNGTRVFALLVLRCIKIREFHHSPLRIPQLENEALLFLILNVVLRVAKLLSTGSTLPRLNDQFRKSWTYET